MSELLDSKQQCSPTGSRVTWITFKVKAVTSSTILPECLCTCACLMFTMNILFNLGATSSKTTYGINKLGYTYVRLCLYQSFQDFKSFTLFACSLFAFRCSIMLSQWQDNSVYPEINSKFIYTYSVLLFISSSSWGYRQWDSYAY